MNISFKENETEFTNDMELSLIHIYGLEEKLEVGRVSNMYDITNAMKEASKVITI